MMSASKYALLTMVIILSATGLTSCAEEAANEAKPYYKEITIGEIEIPEEWDLSGDEVPYGLVRSHADSMAYKQGEKHFMFDSVNEDFVAGLSADGMPTSSYEIELYDVTGKITSYCFLYYYGKNPLSSLDALAQEIYNTGSTIAIGMRDTKDVEYLQGYIAPINYEYKTSGMSSGVGIWTLWKPFADDAASEILGEGNTFLRFIGPEGLQPTGDNLVGFEYTNGEQTIIIDVKSVWGEGGNWVYYDSEDVYNNPANFSYRFEEDHKNKLKERIEIMKRIWNTISEDLTEKGLYYLYDDSRNYPGYIPDYYVRNFEYYDFPQVWHKIYETPIT